MAELASIDSPVKPADLRERLLSDLRNVELRQKYLATRTAGWAALDLRSARERLVMARVIRGIIGLILVGMVGGWLGELLLPPRAAATGARALPIVVGVGSVLCGGAVFALLGSIGCVVLPEVVGEERVSSHGSGAAAVFGQFMEAQMDATCGGVWGAVCGVFIGLLTLAVQLTIGLPQVGSVDAISAGAIGGGLLGIVFGTIVYLTDRRNGPSNNARAWANFGPLPLVAYLLSARWAGKFYLSKQSQVRRAA